MKDYEQTFGGDAGSDALSAALRADYHDAGQSIDQDDRFGRWLWRAMFDVAIAGLSVNAALEKHRNEWRAALGLPSLSISLEPPRPIHVEGERFIDDRGKVWPWRGMTHFCLLSKWLQSGDVRALVREARGYGANLLRVFVEVPDWAGNLALNPTQVPDFYHKLGAFLDQLAAEGMRAELTVFTDRDIIPADQDKRVHFNRVCDVVRTKGGVHVIEAFNEDHIDYTLLSKPVGVVSCAGSRGGDQPPHLPPYMWDYATFHERRDYPGWIKDAVTHELIDGYPGYDGTRRATVHDEPIKFGDEDIPDRQTSSLQLIEQFGYICAATCAGGSFHPERGNYSEPLTPHQADGARHMFAAMIAVTG
jgi:hypothetical protein